MIIGGNNQNNNMNSNRMYENSLRENNNFNTKFNRIKEESKNIPIKNPFVDDIKTKHYSDPTSAKSMNNKSLAMLQERLNNGLISLEEFNKKCAKLNKK